MYELLERKNEQLTKLSQQYDKLLAVLRKFAGTRRGEAMDMISDGLDFLDEQIAAFASRTFTYRTSGNYSFSITAMLGRAFTPPVVGAGPPPDPTKAERDFIVIGNDLVNGSDNVFTPLTTDSITEVIDGDTHVYKVASPLAGGPHWSFVDGYRGDQARIVIHTKYAGIEE